MDPHVPYLAVAPKLTLYRLSVTLVRLGNCADEDLPSADGLTFHFDQHIAGPHETCQRPCLLNLDSAGAASVGGDVVPSWAIAGGGGPADEVGGQVER